MTAATLQATPHIAIPVPKTISRSSADSEFRTGPKCIIGRSERPATRSASLSWALDLSKSRAHEAVLDILRAYKLTGNFHVNLEIVLKDIGVFDKVTYRIERNPNLSYSQDCRHVVFKPNGNVPNDMFGDIMKSIKARIGFDAPWWVRLFRDHTCHRPRKRAIHRHALRQTRSKFSRSDMAIPPSSLARGRIFAPALRASIRRVLQSGKKVSPRT